MPFIGVQPASALLTSADIQDGQITTAKVADDAITGAKIENSPTIANGLTLTDGDITLASGHGISFTATANSSGSMASELLDDYEEGTWTPTLYSASSATISSVSGAYTKIGRLVNAHFSFLINSNSDSNNLTISGLPFTVGSTEGERGAIAFGYQNSGNIYISNAPVDSTRFDIYNNSGAYYTFQNWSNKSLKATFIYKTSS